ncbi:MAG: glycosyltransferase [Paludibacteraceae bacterium]|nr:glycosyltransferase [Paludibacteraceae bacterium]
MNVLFLASWYPGNSNPHSGVFIKEHAVSVRRTGCNIYLVVFRYINSKQLLKIETTYSVDENGINIYSVDVKGRIAKYLNYFFPFQLFLTQDFVSRLTKRNALNLDLVHSNVIFPAGIIGHFIAQSKKIPHVITEHWSRVGSVANLPFIGYFVKRSYQHADAIMPVSKFLKSQLADFIPQLGQNKFSIIGNVIDPNVFFYKEKRVLDRNKPIFCAIATWMHKRVPDKLPELFIESLAEYQNATGISPKLVMVGAGDMVDDLKKMCYKKNLNAEFRGALNKKEIAHVLQSVDFFIHATTIETFGVVVAEALMTGTPVICSAKGALPELVNAANGVLCENSVADWVEKITQILSMNFDSLTISKDLIEKYSTKTIGNEILSVYKEAILSKKS